MKALYVTSVEPFIGKTALCLALGKRLQADGYKVGYLKPMSIHPWRTAEGKLGDEDAAFARTALGLDADLAELTPVIVTASPSPAPEGHGRERPGGEDPAGGRAGRQGQGCAAPGGRSSLREGYAMGLSNLRLAQMLGAPVLVHGQIPRRDAAARRCPCLPRPPGRSDAGRDPEPDPGGGPGLR